jgi:hypothetical protein
MFDMEPPPPVTADSTVMMPPLLANHDKSLLLSPSVNPTSLRTSDEDDHMDLFLPQGLLFDCFRTDQPPSPLSVVHYHDTSSINLAMTLPPDLHPPVLGSVTRICGQPRVFGFTDGFFVRCISANDSLLMDSGANICITNSIGLLFDAVDIPPFTFSIGRGGGTSNIDNCCTKCGLLPLPLVDGSLYY